ncbi:MAG: hypothetical protein RI973_465 [Bacteroidota bacterium]|jgi:hypothetical protein
MISSFSGRRFQQFANLGVAGYVSWLLLLVLAIAFYKERAFFMDAGFQLFNLVNEKRIQIYHHRFVTALPQLLPYLLLELGAPLWLLALSFSVAYVLFHSIVYYLLVSRFRGQLMGWVLISLFTFISLDSFYHLQSEFYLGLSLLLLLFGVVLSRPTMDFGWGWLSILLLAVAVGFSHKLALIFFGYSWLFFFLRNPVLRHRKYVLFALLFIVVAALKSAFFTNWYEAAKQVDFQTNLQQYLPALHRIPAHRIFWEHCQRHYYLLPVLMLFTSLYQLYQRHWARLVLMWLAVPAYLLLYHISDPGTPYRFYAEVSYLPVILFVSLPFFYDLVDDMLRRWHPGWVSLGLLLVVASRLIVIADNRRTFSRQFSWIKARTEQLERAGENRMILGGEGIPMDSVIMEWGIPFTAMHLSSLEQPGASRTVLIMPDPAVYDAYMGRSDCFLTPFKVMKDSELNGDYYQLSPGYYRRPDELK